MHSSCRLQYSGSTARDLRAERAWDARIASQRSYLCKIPIPIPWLEATVEPPSATREVSTAHRMRHTQADGSSPHTSPP
eukprot:3453419-Rhodomonas_salina.1